MRKVAGNPATLRFFVTSRTIDLKRILDIGQRAAIKVGYTLHIAPRPYFVLIFTAFHSIITGLERIGGEVRAWTCWRFWRA